MLGVVKENITLRVLRKLSLKKYCCLTDGNRYGDPQQTLAKVREPHRRGGGRLQEPERWRTP